MKWLKKNALNIFIVSLVFLIAIGYFWRDIIFTIHSGEKGVSFRRFGGGTQTEIFDEGTHLKFPWDIVYRYDMRIQMVVDTAHVLSNDGLSILVYYAMQFRPKVSELAQLHQEIGPDYAKKVVFHEISSVIREKLSRYSPSEIYSLDRDVIRNLTFRIMTKELADRHIDCIDMMIEDIELPKTVSSAIETKITMMETARAYQYRIEQEGFEIDRKVKEANGIREFERITGLSYLKLKGLEVTQKLAESPNSKIILLGTDEKLPILLNGEVK